LAVFEKASNMTERMHGLAALVHIDHPLAAGALAQFHALFKHEELVLDKWFALQASASGSQSDVLAKVRQLMQHPDFHVHNPNRARSLISSYCVNAAAFHRSDAEGYVFWSERVLEIDSFNPQVAARLARTLDRWRKLVEPYRSAAHEAIRRVAAKDDLSADVREVINAALED
jgi:aminopeptidase N